LYNFTSLDRSPSPGEALSRAELSKAELELEINKIKTEDASLRDALLKMQALNEGLGQDKIELNKIIMQVRAAWIGRFELCDVGIGWFQRCRVLIGRFE
jgi:hypothetical protein